MKQKQGDPLFHIKKRKLTRSSSLKDVFFTILSLIISFFSPGFDPSFILSNRVYIFVIFFHDVLFLVETLQNTFVDRLDYLQLLQLLSHALVFLVTAVLNLLSEFRFDLFL